MEITKFYSGQHPSEVPFYSQRDVAAVCGLSPSTLRGWLAPTKRDGVSDALIDGPEGADGRLSFQNLAEAYLVVQLRSQGGVSVRRLRNTVVYHRGRGIERPFLNAEDWLVGGGIYLSDGDDLVDASDWGQYVLEPIIGGYIDRLEVDAGKPITLYPAYGGGDGRAVKVDPRVRFGSPSIVGTGIRTATIWARAQSGEKLPDIAEGYGIELDLAAEALRYEASRHAA